MKQPCPWCHEPKANLYEHWKTCKLRPAGAELPRKRAPRGSPAVRKPPAAAKPAAPSNGGGTGAACDGCPGRCLKALNVPQVQAVESLVREGVRLERSAAIVQRLMGAEGGSGT